MERQPPVVAAAEAVRDWIHAQRASWPPSAPLAATAALVPAAVGATLLTSLPFPIAEPLVDEPEPEVVPVPAVAEPVAKTRRWTNDVNWRAYARPAGRAAAVAAVLACLAGAGLWARGAIAKYRAASRTSSAVSEPDSAAVAVDATPAGRQPAAANRPAGSRATAARAQEGKSIPTDGAASAKSAATEIGGTAHRVGTLQLETSPSGARVIVDGRDRGVTPLTIDDLAPGGHKVVLESEEGTLHRTVQVVEGQTEVLSEAIFAGWLHVAAPVDVVVSERGRPLQMDARGQVLLKAGDHDLLIESRAFGFSQKRRVSIEPGGTATLDIEMGMSTLSVTATAAADVQVDGVRAGATPLVDFPLKVGTHDVVITDIFGNTQRRSLRVTSAPASIEVDFTKR